MSLRSPRKSSVIQPPHPIRVELAPLPPDVDLPLRSILLKNSKVGYAVNDVSNVLNDENYQARELIVEHEKISD
jgi:hypothetical protein